MNKQEHSMICSRCGNRQGIPLRHPVLLCSDCIQLFKQNDQQRPHTRKLVIGLLIFLSLLIALGIEWLAFQSGANIRSLHIGEILAFVLCTGSILLLFGFERCPCCKQRTSFVNSCLDCGISF
jgi:hypothetical protein